MKDAADIQSAAVAIPFANGDTPPPGWVSFDSIPLPFEELRIDPSQESRIVHGQTVLIRGSDSGENRPACAAAN